MAARRSLLSPPHLPALISCRQENGFRGGDLFLESVPSPLIRWSSMNTVTEKVGGPNLRVALFIHLIESHRLTCKYYRGSGTSGISSVQSTSSAHLSISFPIPHLRGLCTLDGQPCASGLAVLSPDECAVFETVNMHADGSTACDRVWPAFYQPHSFATKAESSRGASHLYVLRVGKWCVEEETQRRIFRPSNEQLCSGYWCVQSGLKLVAIRHPVPKIL